MIKRDYFLVISSALLCTVICRSNCSVAPQRQGSVPARRRRVGWLIDVPTRSKIHELPWDDDSFMLIAALRLNLLVNRLQCKMTDIS